MSIITLKQARSLGARQVKSVSVKSLALLEKRGLNSRLARSLLLESNNREVLEKVVNYLVSRAEKGDVRFLPGLLLGIKDSDERNCWRALSGLRSLAEKGDVKAKKAIAEEYNKRK